MDKPLIVYKIATNFKDLLDLDSSWQSIDFNWEQEALGFSWQFLTALSDTHFYYAVRTDAPFDYPDSIEPGSFYEGLWEYTVAELFLFSSKSTSYQEFNVAFNSSWWQSCFKDYRQAVECNVPLTLKSFSFLEGAYSYAGFSIEKTELLFDIEQKDTRVNLCGILFSKQPDFISLNPKSDQEADFHLASQGLNTKIVNFENESL